MRMGFKYLTYGSVRIILKSSFKVDLVCILASHLFYMKHDSPTYLRQL